MRVFHNFRLVARAAFRVLFLSAALLASAQGTSQAQIMLSQESKASQGAPTLGFVTTSTLPGEINLTWINFADAPEQFLGFAWDLYTNQWVDKGWAGTIWYPFPSSAISGRMNLGNSGGYHVWISNFYLDSSLHPAANPWTGVVKNGKPHTPIDVRVSPVDENLVRIEWEPEIFGTWLYWIITYNLNTEDWVATDGPLGESVWHYVAYGENAFTNGQVEIGVPARGEYMFFVAGMAWDGMTMGDFGTVYVDTVSTNYFLLPGDVFLEMVKIPAGSFEMGAPISAPGLDGDETPIHTVAIENEFHIGKYEVTQEQWLAIMGSWPGQDPADGNFGRGDRYPAYYVSWNDITGPDGFIDKLNLHIAQSDQPPVTFRLPTEAEWEYACRAGAQTRFYFGDALSPADGGSDGPAGTLPGNRSDYMWFWFNSQGDENGVYGSKEVGEKRANQYGLYDMSGNVWEWCQDWYHTDYSEAPADGSAWVEPAGEERVVRGGFWNLHAEDCQSANRHSREPDSRNFNDLGFRLVLTEEGSVVLNGTIFIDVEPDDGEWTLYGPSGFTTLSEMGDMEIGDAPPGFYTLEFDDIDGYETPDEMEEELESGGTIYFEAEYDEDEEDD